MVTATGGVYSGSGFTPVAAFASGQTPALFPTINTSGGSGFLNVILGATSGIGQLNLGTKVSGFIPTPFANPEVMFSASGSLNIALGGWDETTIASGFNTAAFHPTQPLTMATTTSAATNLQLWTNNGSGTFAVTQTLTSGLAPNSLAWTPNGNELLAGLAASGINIYSYNGTGLAFSGTVAAGASPTTTLAITPDSLNALTLQPAANTLTQLLVSGGTLWVSGATIALNSPQSIVSTGPETMVVGFASGLATYVLAGSAWSLATSAEIGFTPSYLALDSNLNVTAAGTSGASGYIYSTAASAVSGSYTGTVSGLIVVLDQYAVLDAANGKVRVFGLDNGVWTQQTNNPFAANGANLLAYGSGFAFTSSISVGKTKLMVFGAPFTLNAAMSGEIGLYNGAWTTTSLGPGFRPTAVTFDSSGNILAATENNWLITVASGGGITASGVITQQVGQAQTVPLGISSLQWLNGHLYGVSSLCEAFMVLI